TLPNSLGFLGKQSQIGCDELVLRGEVPVEGHFVGGGQLRDCIDADRSNAPSAKEISSCGEDALAPRNLRPVRPLPGVGSGHRLLTECGVGCYRSVTCDTMILARCHGAVARWLENEVAYEFRSQCDGPSPEGQI